MVPYKLKLVQKLKDTDKPLRRDFCIAMQEKLEDNGFDDRLVFSDEATFYLNGKVNKHSTRIWGTECDFFLWGFVKQQVYVPPLPRDIDELKARITAVVGTIDVKMLERVWQEMDYRLDVCRVTNGAHIEQV